MKKIRRGDLSLCVYMPTEKPRAVVQIAHGMEEHQGRYENFAKFLTTRGFAVVTADMRGHGEDTPTENLGYFDEKNGWQLLLRDESSVRDYIDELIHEILDGENHESNSEGKDFRENAQRKVDAENISENSLDSENHAENPDIPVNNSKIPVYLIAHSMGSIISRVLLQTESARYDKVVLTGFPCSRPGVGFGIFLANIFSAVHGAKYRSKTLAKLSTGVFNKSIEAPATDHDWICANPETVQRFIDDPLCGFGFTSSAYRDLFKLVKLLGDSSRTQNVNNSLNILLLSGAEDPCTGGEKGVCDSIEKLRRCGFTKLTEKNYTGMRHEILNETENGQVYEDIADFLENGTLQ